MVELTPEEIRGLLEATTPGPWVGSISPETDNEDGSVLYLDVTICGPVDPDHLVAHWQYAEDEWVPLDGDIRLLAAAPDLARQLLAAMEENERLAGEVQRKHWAMERSRKRATQAEVRSAEQATTIATLEGIVRRLLDDDGWSPLPACGDGPCWSKFDGHEPMSEAEALILKEMQQ